MSNAVSKSLPVLREVLSHGENALLCPSEEPAAWASALLALKDDEKLRARIGRQGEKDFLARYTWDQRARAILGVTNHTRADNYLKDGGL